MTQEALKLALEALDSINSPLHVREIYKVGWAMKAIKEALAQTEQEPVKYSDYEPDGVHHTAPPKRTWVGLTDEEYAELAEEFGSFPINQIEAKLKEKNT